MAFVYCDDRWKQTPQSQLPGPGQYELDKPETLEKKKSSHHRSPNFKRTNQIQSCSDKNMHSKTWYNQQQQLQERMDQSIKIRKQSLKKGKLYRKTTIPKNEQTCQDAEDRQRLYINNSEKNLSIAEKDRWGNMKIIELLKQHKEKERKNPIRRFTNPTKRNVFTYKTRQQLQSDLKEMEIMYNSQRNRTENAYSLKNFNREISSKQKQRENNSHQYFQTVNRNISGAKEEKSNEELSVQPSVIFKTPLDDTLNKPQITLKESPTQSFENSKIIKREATIQTATGISDDLFEDSIQYIEDATPGPGAYNLDTSSLTSLLKQTSGKKIQKFGVTMQRFRVNKDKIREAQTFINPVHPTFKKSSQANQELVGFGKGTKEEKETEPIHNGVFYQDLNNLENISKKTLLKSKNNQKFSFQSCQSRFQYQKNKKVSTSSDQQIIEPDQEDQPQGQIIPSYIFLSKVQRQVVPNTTITDNVDFSGQNYSCMANKLKKQKQFYQDYEIKPVPFMVKDNRFKYEQVQTQEKREELKLLKIKELKEKKENNKKKNQKGYSFGKEEKKENCFRQSPSPDKYQLEQDWVKKTYNLRFR